MEQLAERMEAHKIEEQQPPLPELQQLVNLKPKKLIIVTGFGPFVGHEDVNASWEAVRLLPDTIEFKDTEYIIEKQMIDVEYNVVDKAIVEIWERKPELVIHCGVHGMAQCVHVEKLAYNNCFKRPDYAGKFLPSHSAKLTKCPRKGARKDVLRCMLNISKIIDAIRCNCECKPALNDAAINGIVARPSNEVGDYLCGYIYLKSLDRNPRRSLFVHVPPIDKPFTSQQTSEILYDILEECVRQVNDLKPKKC